MGCLRTRPPSRVFVAWDLPRPQMGARPSRDIVLIPLETTVTETWHMKLSRELQREMLEHLRDCYPNGSDEVVNLGDHGQSTGNLYYLRELGLVTLLDSEYMSGEKAIHQATITAKGLDFIEDDGGVGAILGTVTVKLHEDTLRQLIEAKVQASNLPAEQKSGILKALREAPGETTKQLITKLVDLGMENAPRAIPLIQTLLQGGQP